MQGFSYSKELVAECIACFERENGITLTPEHAQEVLASFGGLFLAFSDMDAGASTASVSPQVSVTPVERCRMHHD